eukprot:2999530-Rhodomonas_salina.1
MDNGIILDAVREGSLMCYVNTSCDPNVSLVQQSIEGMDELFYVSMCEIAAGEDITTSYGDKTWNGAVTPMSSTHGSGGGSQGDKAVGGRRVGGGMGGKGAQAMENGDDLVSSLSRLEGGDDDVEWLETKEEAKERTIIDLLEKNEMARELENGAWENLKEDETINLIPSSSSAEESEAGGTAASSSKPHPEMAKKLLLRKGKCVWSSMGKGRDSFKWVALESEFDKKATKILQRFCH